jgi:hypothetical protein
MVVLHRAPTAHAFYMLLGYYRSSFLSAKLWSLYHKTELELPRQKQPDTAANKRAQRVSLLSYPFLPHQNALQVMELWNIFSLQEKHGV